MRRVLGYVLCYLLWVVSAALGFLGLLVGRGLLIGLFSLTRANRWVLSAIDKFGLLILGLICLGFVIFCESYYREGVEESKLWKRFGLVTAAEFFLFLLAYVVPFFI